MKTIRIFISSPGDVAEERDRARQVVEQLSRRYAGRLQLKAVLWEDLPLEADMSFQQGIDLVLSQEQGVDIAVFILWSRLGLPLGALVRKPDGSAYRSGTEREFDLVMAARRQSGDQTPKILIYTRKDDGGFDERLRGKPTDEQGTLVTQKQLVETFIREVFHDSASGANVRAYHTFDQPTTFSQRLRVHLQEMLDAMTGEFEGDPVWDTGKKGSPFRGLEAFEFEHNAVFFGREDEVLEVRRALQRKAQEGCAFVLISGASGSGKSSLARAGVLPAIVEYEVDSTVNGWRYAVCTPSQLGNDLCAGLARLLCAENVLPELRVAADSVAVLGEGFASAPKLTVDQSVRPALARAARGKPGAIRLCLLVDQLEELFTDKRLKDDERERFTAAMESLARSGGVWVLGTVRSDFYPHCQRLPALIRMKEGPGQIDLLLPTTDALRRLIVHPARLAGLTFEQREGASLADRILNDAAAHAELLPLLSYLLRELFEQRTDNGVLTFAAYEELGAVEGALARRAETVFAALPEVVKVELNPVLRTLVSVSGDEEESVVRQRVPLETFPPETPARALVNQFVAERFLVTDADVGGGATVAVAHEALLRVWNRAAQWIADNRDFLRVRARVAARMKEGSRLLDGDSLLELARHHLVTIRAGFTREQTDFIEDCLRIAHDGRRRRERVRKGVFTVLATLALVAMGAAGFAFKQRKEADALRQSAEVAAWRAEAAATEARITLSESDFLQATRLIAAGERNDAVAYLTQSLSANPTNDAAVARLASLLIYHSWWLTTLKMDALNTALFSSDGTRIVTASRDGTVRVLDAPSGQPVMQWRVGTNVVSAQFSPEGRRVVTAATDGTVRVWDAQSGQPATEPMKDDSLILSAQFSPEGKRIVTASRDGTVRVWNPLDGRRLMELAYDTNWVSAQSTNTVSAQFSPDGKWIFSKSVNNGGLRIWDANSGQRVIPPFFDEFNREEQYMNHGEVVKKERNDVVSVQFSPDGKQFVVSCIGKLFPDSIYSKVLVYDETSNQQPIELKPPTDEANQYGFGLDFSAQFSPDGRRVVTAASHGTARVWDAQNGRPLTKPLKHRGPISSAQFSPDGNRILTMSEDRFTMWDAQNGRLLTESLKHKGPVSSAQFSPDGKQVIAVGTTGTAEIWEEFRGQLGMESVKHGERIGSAQFSPEGTRIVTTSDDGTVRVWDAVSGQNLIAFKHGTNAVSAQFSSDGKRILTTTEHSKAQVWDAQNGQLLFASLGDGDIDSARFEAQFSPDGKWIVIVSTHWKAGAVCTVRVWNAQTFQPLTEPLKHDGFVSSAQFSPDGKRIVTRVGYGALQLWDAQNGQLLLAALADGDIINSEKFSPEGTRILTVSGDGKVRVWNTGNGRLEAEPMRHINPVPQAQFSPDGRWILTASGEDGVQIWDAQTGQSLMAPLDRDGNVRSAEFSPDGKRIATAGDNGIQIWDAQSGQPLTEPLNCPGMSAAFSPDGKRILTASGNVCDVSPVQQKLPDWLFELTEAVSGQLLNKRGVLEETKLNRAETIKEIREKLSQDSSGNDWSLLGRWFLADPATRTISPFSKVTVPQYIEDRIKEGTAESLDEAQRLAGGNTNLLQRIFQARTTLKPTKPE